MGSRVEEEEWVEEVGTTVESEVEGVGWRGWAEERLGREVGTWLSKVEEVMGEEEEVVVVVVEAGAAVTATASCRRSRQAASLAWSRRRVEGPRCLGWRGSRTCWG